MGRILNSLLNRDARRLVELVKDPIVDVIITSPPYADLKDYGVHGQIGFGQDYAKEYLPSLRDVFQQCFKVTKLTGSLWVVADTFKKRGEVRLLPFEIANMCKDSGWLLADVIIWDKGKTLPWSRKGQLRNLFEYILFFTKSHDHKYYVDRIKDPIDLKEWWVKYPERYSFGGKNPSNIWRIPIPVQGSWAQNDVRHFCPFPPELVERILLLTTDEGDIVLDPFAGSGMVLAQAKCMKRRYVGFEINPLYVRGFKKAVLPAMRKHWKRTQKEMRKLEVRRKEFESKIQALRILKFPKSIIKGLQRKKLDMVHDIGAILVEQAVALPTQPNKFARSRLTFIVNDEDTVAKLKHHVNLVMSKPPVSKFGIESDIDVKLASECFSDERRRPKSPYVYVYSGGRTHHYEERTTLKEIAHRLAWNRWASMQKKGMPPIISTLGIRQELTRTWYPKHLEER